MRTVCMIVFFVFYTFLGTPQTTFASSSYSTKSLEQRYLRQARAYRAQGRYELARQNYVLALSLCSKTDRLETIRQELDGLELLLRTLR